MKKIMALMAVCFSLNSSEIPQGWKYAYQGDFNLTHKYVLMQDPDDDREILELMLMMAYVHYKMDDYEGMKECMKGLDMLLSCRIFIEEQSEGKQE